MALTLVKPNIKQAFASFHEGITKDHDVLVQYISNPEISDEDLCSCLKELQECLTELGKDKDILVAALMKISWTNRSPKTIHLYQGLVLSLLSAHTFYLRAGLVMIVRKFIPAKVFKEDTEITADKLKEDAECFLQLHTLLRAIIQIIPMASDLLLPMLSDAFPYHTRPSYVHQCYIQNLLELRLYLPKYREKVLELIIDRATKLDLQCPRNEMKRLEDFCDDDTEMGMFEMEEIPSELKKEAKDLHRATEKLDIVMEQIMNHIKQTCFPQGTLDWQATKCLYRELLTAFNKTLLPTHACSHVQYVMFYICSFHESLSEGFLDYLWKKVRDPNTQPVFRQTAVAYIDSFVARAMFISVHTVKAVLDLLVPWVHGYIRQTAETNTRPDVKRHGPFYSVCQAIFYILIFRHKDLFSINNGLEYCQTLNLQTIVTCRLNPLRFCLDSVISAFASIARQHQLAFCDVIIEKNRRSFLPEASSDSTRHATQTKVNPLDSFFPFDPCLLRRTSMFVDPLFREYTGADIPKADSEHTSQEEEEEYMDVGSLGTPGITCFSPSSVTLAKSPASPSCVDFLLHGTSPGFKQP